MTKSILDDLPLNIPEATGSKKSSVPETTFVAPAPPVPKKGKPNPAVVLNYIAEFNRLDDEAKRIEAAQKRIGALIKEQGLKYVVEHNVEHGNQPTKQIASVSLLDPVNPADPAGENGPAEKVMFSMMNKYLKFDREQAVAVLSALLPGRKVSVDDYLCWKLDAAFDTTVFYVDGVFSKDRFDLFVGALANAAEEAGVANPLSMTKTPAVKDDFHQKRWQDFTVEQNLALQKVLACTLSLKPVRPQA